MALLLVILIALFFSLTVLACTLPLSREENKRGRIDKEFYRIAEMLDDIFPDDLRDDLDKL